MNYVSRKSPKRFRPIPVRDIDLYMNREKLLQNLNWMNELRSKFIEVYSATM